MQACRQEYNNLQRQHTLKNYRQALKRTNKLSTLKGLNMSFKPACLNIFCTSLAFIFINLLSISFFSVQAQEVCPLINCDCESIPKPSWQKACINYERVIKLDCVQNQNTPKDYCALHGPEAFPLPLLSTKLEIKPPTNTELADAQRDVDTVYWSINTDIEFIDYNLNQKTLKETFEGLKNLDGNILELLKAQSTVSHIITNQSSKRSAASKKQWKKYAQKNEAIHTSIKALTYKLENSFSLNEIETSKMHKMYHALYVRSLRTAGKAHELSALAYSHAKKHYESSQHWVQASALAQQLLTLEESLQANEKHRQYYQILAASRLQRASYHQLLKKKTVKAEELLDQSLALNPVPIFEQNLLTSKF